MVGSMKRRHEDSNYGSVPALSEYHLRKESVHASRNASHPSQDQHTGDDRVNSPKNILDNFRMYSSPRDHSKRTLSFSSKHKEEEEHDWEHDEDAEKRVTIWNWREQRKLSGNSAPFKKNLKEYIRKHPDWEEYVGQDKDVNGKKLSPKKMKPPAPMNPDHPALRENYSPPSSPGGGRSSYSTRSSYPRQSSQPASTHREPTEFAASASFHQHPDLDKPMPLMVESSEAVAQRRAIEMASRRQAMETNDTEQGVHGELKADTEQEKAEVAWKEATEAVARAKAEKEAAELKLANESALARRSAHSEVQCGIAQTASARIQAFKRRRMLIQA